MYYQKKCGILDNYLRLSVIIYSNQHRSSGIGFGFYWGLDPFNATVTRLGSLNWVFDLNTFPGDTAPILFLFWINDNYYIT